MNAIEAIIYCLGFVNETPEDYEFHSQTAYDKYGHRHWISWQASHGKKASPRFCSSGPTPFAECLGPYRTGLKY
jgi:hypothetical protein